MSRNDERKFDVETYLESIRETRKRLSTCDFQGIERYLIGQHDKTIMLFLELGEMIEKNIDIFLCPNIPWRERMATDRFFGKETGQNRVRLYPQGDGILYVWIDNGIHFVWNEKTERAVFISHNRGESKQPRYNNYHRFYYINEWADGGYPSNGYERFSVTPTMENYFPEQNPVFLQDYLKLKEKVDDDYENAQLCKTLFEEALKGILESEKRYLSGMRELNLL